MSAMPVELERVSGWDEELRYQYPLSQDSVVVDAGAYLGDWAAGIVARYGCHLHCFEPVPEFAAFLRQRFAISQRITVHPAAVSDSSGTMIMWLDGSATSAYQDMGVRIEVTALDIAAVLRSLPAPDLLKLNIEGEEFPVLARMLDAGVVTRCRDIQVQFHEFYPDAERLRDELHARLSATHRLTYNFPFVWENWRRL